MKEFFGSARRTIYSIFYEEKLVGMIGDLQGAAQAVMAPPRPFFSDD